MNKNYAVVLSGCGAKDGTEIQEAVTLFLAIAKAGNKYAVYAPNINQKHVINHVDDTEMNETRNVLIESARISRGDIKELSTIDISKYDALVLPGGFGAAKNLFDFAFNYTNFSVLPIFENIVKGFHDAGKPIGAMCIAPVMIAKLFGDKGVEITLGDNPELSKDISEKFGAKTTVVGRDGATVDTKNKIVTTACYMYGDSTIIDIANGAEKMVAELDKMM